VDGFDNRTLEEQTEQIGEVGLKFDALDVYIADSPDKQNQLWAMRRSLGEAVKAISAYKEEDTVVPRNKLPELMEIIRKMEEDYGLRAICYGHAGDGNIHVNILKEQHSDQKWEELLSVAIEELFRKVSAIGGSISGEHGIGLTQKQYLPIAIDAAQLKVMRQIKGVFDPNLILNPGKIFPDKA
jgi:glycolate oxidase